MVQRKAAEEGVAVSSSIGAVNKDGAWSDIIMHAAALLVVAALWVAGGYFTNQCIAVILAWFGLTVIFNGWKFFIMPVVFSIIEIYGWERRKRLSTSVRGVALFIGLIDFATSVYGVAVVIAGKTVPLLGGYVIDADPNSTTTLVVGVVVAILLTFPPERVMLSSIKTIRRAIITLQA